MTAYGHNNFSNFSLANLTINSISIRFKSTKRAFLDNLHLFPKKDEFGKSMLPPESIIRAKEQKTESKKELRTEYKKLKKELKEMVSYACFVTITDAEVKDNFKTLFNYMGADADRPLLHYRNGQASIVELPLSRKDIRTNADAKRAISILKSNIEFAKQHLAKDFSNRALLTSDGQIIFGYKKEGDLLK